MIKDNDNWHAVKAQVDKIANARTVNTLRQAERVILDANSARGYSRCTGILTTDRAGLPTLGYCERYECWKCGNIRTWLDVERLTAGLLHIRQAWFITLTLADVNMATPDDDSKSAFSVSVNDVLNVLRQHARRRGHTLRYCNYYGFKQSGQLHAHIVASYVPDAVYSYQRDRYAVYVSEWLKSACERLGLSCHVERMESIDGVSQYLRKNVQSTLYKLPNSFQRVRFSNRWLKSQDAKNMTMYIRKCSTCGQVHYSLTDDNPNRCKSCNNSQWTRAVKKYVSRDELPDLLLYTQEITNKTQLSHSDTPIKCCSTCGECKPITSEHWQVDSSKASGYRSSCKDCLHERDNQRDKRIDRICQNKAKRANRSARDNGQAGIITQSDVWKQYRKQSGACAYCDKPLNNTFQLDHFRALANGGDNSPDNIRCACAKCNRRKGAKSVKQWRSIMASRGYRIEGTPDTMPIAVRML